MLSPDLLSPDKADFYYLVGSDCCCWTTFRPENYFYQGKPVMLYNTRKYFEDEKAGHPIQWMDCTAQILGFPVNGEYMRRLPIVYPKEVFEPCRSHVEAVHRMPFEDYIYKRNKEGGPVSESNILGAFAWEKMRDLYYWMDAGGPTMSPEYPAWRAGHPDIIQWWSHGGMDRRAETCVNYSHGNTAGKTPRTVMREILGNF